MFDRFFAKRFRRLPKLMIVLFTLLSFGIFSRAVAVPAAALQTEPQAGTWGTWVLESASQFRAAAPPDDAATADEIAQLMEMVGQRDEAALQEIAYWNAGPPSYRWNQILMDVLLKQAMGGNMAYRDLALFNVALYDATVAAWDSKYTFNRPRPSAVQSDLTTVIPNPASPSYPSEYAVTAGAASTILGWLFPDQAQAFADKAQAAVNSRLMAGVEYPSDVEAGLALGKQVAELVIARGKADGSDAKWDGVIPAEPGHWTGENPIFPTAGTWKTWALTSGDQFRPPPPPAYDSSELAAQMDEVRAFERTPVTNSIASFWESGSGGRRNYWFWNSIATRLMLAAGWADNAPQAARAYALLNIAGHDASVACWDAKFTYWAIRPVQLDPEFKPLFTTPNHPGYPSAHSCLSTSDATVLAYLFPADAEEVLGLAHEASESRIWAGIHFRVDIDAGIKIGQDVAGVIIARANGTGS